MGCNTSTLDRLPAVTLCRDRCKFIDEALLQSYALADAHVAHMDSLRSLGPSLLCFFEHFQDSSEIETKPSVAKSPPPRSPSSRSSGSDSHFVLHSESETEDTDDEFQPFTQKQSHYDNVAFVNYVQPLYPPFSPPNVGGYSGLKPPSPPPPSNSAWDFLNFFEPYEKYQVPYVRNSENDVTEKKDIGKVKSHEIVKCDASKSKVSEVENGEAKKKKKLVSETEQCSDLEKVKSAKGLCEAVKEIQILFQRASDSGNPLLDIIDVGKLRYHRKFYLTPVSCKVMQVLTPSNRAAVNCMEAPLLGRRKHEGVYKENDLNYANLCSTLKKLCMWEKKLYHEVKAEEKLRILHQKKCKQLKRMIKKEADAHKIHDVQAFIGILATKMKISIQVVDKISITISKLREEELWPQINRFILMFLGMWKDMQECYKSQCKEIAEAKTIDASSFNRKLGNTQIEAAIKLKSEIYKWNLTFSDWIHAQKSHVKALNGWLVRCLMYEPEEIDSTPFSPSTIGAPPVFVICNKWSRAVDNITEKNVFEAVNGFVIKVSELLEKHMLDFKEKLTVDKELERKVKMLEREEQKMHKVVKAREKKMIASERDDTAVRHGYVVDTVNLQSGLKQIFVAMEGFTSKTSQLYEELCQQIKHEEHVLGESNGIL